MHLHHPGGSPNPAWSALPWLLPACALAIAAVVFSTVEEPRTPVKIASGHSDVNRPSSELPRMDRTTVGSSDAEMSPGAPAGWPSLHSVPVARDQGGARIEASPAVLEVQKQADLDLVGASIGAYDR